MFTLGPFALHERIGSGGSGLVWGGVHTESGLKVAVKVLTAEVARDAQWRAAFRHEVRAVAGLSHPGVVVVHEHGVVDREAARGSAFALPRHSPWLAMERVQGGTLSDTPPADWGGVRAVLLGVLDALAHAHARGVVHRDIKPGNVLLGAAGPKLTDFGLAHPLGRKVELPAAILSAGTPAYMAPEQFDVRWRDYGPWTDLYALGCVAWRLTTGQLPFPLRGFATAARAHRVEPPPPFVPSFEAPPGVEAWLRRLLAKAPGDRFQRAADAAWALAELPEIRGDGTRTAAPMPDLPTVALPVLPTPRSPLGAPASPGRPTPPPVPRDWRLAHTDDAPVHGLGLGLYGLRTVPMVGRTETRDRLWGALHRAIGTGRPAAVVLHGPAGCGKSRLARWLTERAHEVGAAEVLTATHGPTGGPADGLGPLVTRAMGGIDLDRAQLYGRIRGLGWMRTQAAALVQLAAPVQAEADDGVPRVHFGDASERHSAARTLVERLARGRPVVVWLDDVQWGFDALQWATSMLTHGQGPVLLVLTARDEALPAQPAEARALKALTARPDVESVAVAPLDGPERSALVRSLLGLAGPLAAEVEARTAGNPLFAVQLVGDWIERGLMVATPEGFRLREGASAPMPDDLHAVWAAHLARVLGRYDAAASAAVELAAVLGHEVHPDEWSAACAAAGLAPPFDAVEALVDARLARAPRGPRAGWRFVHGMLRESLVRLATEAGRVEAHHRACAATLRGRGTDERVGHHLLGAGDTLRALPWILGGAKDRIDAGEVAHAELLLDSLERSMDAAAVPADAVLRGRAGFTRVVTLLGQGRIDEAMVLRARVEADARRFGWEEVLTDTRLKAAEREMAHGRFEAAATAIDEAEAIAERIGDVNRAANAAHVAGWLHLLQGRPAEVEPIVLRCLERLDGARKVHIGNAMYLLAVAKRTEDDAACRAWLDRARAAYEEDGAREGVARCDNVLGELERAEGNLAGAERHYQRALDFYGPLGHADTLVSELNLGLVRAQAGRHDDARGILERTRAALLERNLPHYLPTASLALALGTLAAGDLDGTEALVEEALTTQARTGTIELDYASLADALARQAADPQPDLARRVADWAADHWRRLGRTEQADELLAVVAGRRPRQ